MTRQPFERILKSFVADVPEVAPRELLESVLIDLPSVKQRRRRFGVGRRFRDMSTPLRVLATTAAVLVVAVVAYTLLPRPAGVGSSPTPTPVLSPSPTRTPSASPTPAPSPRIAGATVIGDGTPFAQGVNYVLADFEQPFKLSGSPQLLFLADGPRYAWFGATSSGSELSALAPGSAFDENGTTVELPTDLVAWIEARTDLDVTSTTPVELGSASGTLIEATVHADAHVNGGGAVNLFCPGPVARCFFEEGGSLGYQPGDHLLLLVTSVKGTPVVAHAAVPPAEWDRLRTDIDAFLRSIEFPA